MTHLIKNNCSDECDVWCDAYINAVGQQTTDPSDVTCLPCLEAAHSHAIAIGQRLVNLRYLKKHGVHP